MFIVPIKSEDDYSMAGSPMVEHDYSKEDFLSKSSYATSTKQSTKFHDFTKTSQASSMKRPSTPLTPSTVRGNNRRTFAPPLTSQKQNPSKKTQPKLKVQKQKSSLMWQDFPYTTDQIINMPVEKFNEIVKQLDEIRQHVAKDVRRKGKNKLAARNCRKRKMDVIDDLDCGISHLEQQRRSLMMERKQILDETRHIQQKTEWLNNYILEHLRDDNGIPYSTSDYSLQYTADGNVYLVPSAQGQSTV